MPTRLTRKLFALAVFLFLAACGKKQAPVTPIAVSVTPAAATKSAAPSPSVPENFRFTGEVVAHEEFQKTFAPKMTFRLEPYAGDDSGWSIRIAPIGESGAPAIGCIGAVEMPLHGDTKIEIEPPESGAVNSPAWRQREFEYVATEPDCRTAWNLMNDANYGTKLTDAEREQASAKLGQVPTRHGKFTILDVRFGSAGKQPVTIEWLKFDVDLSAPDAPVQSSAAKGDAKTTIAATGKGIRGVDLQKFLETHYREVHPDLQAEPDIDLLKEECGENQEPIRSLAPFQFGDLDGDGQEEAVYQGFTCMSGTAGVDFFGVLKLMPGGKIVALPIEGEREEFKGRKNIYDGLRGHLSLVIRDARLVETYPVYTGNEANCCPEGGERNFVYRWDGHQFVLDDIIDSPPRKGGT